MIRFLYLGQIRQSKGVDHLVLAAEQLIKEGHDLAVSLAGPVSGWGSDTFAPDILAKVQSNTVLTSHIAFLGHVEDVDTVFRSHDVHIAPSIGDESYGLVVVEAKKNSRPSIIYPSGGMLELVDHLSDGWVCKTRTAASLVEGMRFFLENPSLVKGMGVQALDSLSRLAITPEHFDMRWASILKTALH
ncbi:MAG: glycosyltransferase family 4 protein [Hyphomonadaceae bacterium]|nr:glycosyltransferase family 4 protein [Hyphomonadaceae bacterium]MBY0565136.1 glycosyltransferase family 4 protein [Hyphomonadaceae bacterium]